MGHPAYVHCNSGDNGFEVPTSVAGGEVADRSTAAVYHRKKMLSEKAQWRVKETGQISDAGRLNFSPPPETELADMLAGISNVTRLQPILPRDDRSRVVITEGPIAAMGEKTDLADDARLDPLTMMEPEDAAEVEGATVAMGERTELVDDARLESLTMPKTEEAAELVDAHMIGSQPSLLVDVSSRVVDVAHSSSATFPVVTDTLEGS
ncbi:hypothetical protein SLA2020_281470 [Shorea laevis]